MASSQQYAPVHVGVEFSNEVARREAEQHRAQRARQKQALVLQKENILSQRTSNPARRNALEAARLSVLTEPKAIPCRQRA